MIKVRASAPGKVILLGEYAVLFGAPALVMAVDRCAKVEILPSERPGIEVTAPEVWPDPVRIAVLQSGVIGWPVDDAALQAAFALVAEILLGLWQEGLLPSSMACSIRIDTSELFHRSAVGQSKLGLGSSAALTVALASALTAFSGHASRLDDRASWHRRLFRLHRGFQAGRGSGIDIAASLYGGTLCYRLENDEPQVEAARWPVDLRRTMIWTGSSASTSSFLAQLDAWRDREPVNSRLLLDDLMAMARRGADAAASGATAVELLHCCQAFVTALQQFSAASKIPVLSEKHLRILNLVVSAGAVYKPCGAGGGDLGMALTLKPELQSRVEHELDIAGFPILNLAEQSSGLRCQCLPVGEPFEDD